MPIRDRDDATEVEDRIGRFFAAQREDRPDILRGLFAEVLDFEREVGRISLAAARERAGIELPASAERIASLGAVQVLYVALADTDTERVRKSEVAAVAKLVRDELGEDMLLLFSNRSTSQLHLIHPRFDGNATPTLRRMVVDRDVPRRTAVQQVSNIYWRYQDLGNILDALDEAFDVEPVTKQFFAKYKELFEQAEQRITGFSEHEECKQFVQTLFNRLLFVYFLSRKGWLKFEGNTDYLNALWDAYEHHEDHNNFYRHRLTYLFFSGLNNPDSRDVRGGVDFMIGDVPFLNGGLFEETELDKRDGVVVPDEAIQPLLTELFDKFNFTVMESTPFDIEVAVDPEMLGKVFEELVTGRHDSGAYYTPRAVVSFMCREALKGYLETQQPDLDPDAIRQFVDQHDASKISIFEAGKIQEALEAVTVVDPACGSGAYLVGMMQELVDLRVELYNQKLKQDARSLYELKLHIIERNVHGVDLDPFAVNIAMLRLWLSLAIEFDGPQPEPLPNLHFKILEGDSLLGPDPSQLSLDSGLIKRSGLGPLKAKFLRASNGSEKDRLRDEIENAKAQVRNALAGANVAEGAVDWRVEFAEVFAERGGFDVAVANPPYIQLQKDGGRLRRLYADSGYETLVSRGDIYQLFFERGCQVLRPEKGLLAYITSNSWLRAKYGERTRRYFTDRHEPVRWLDLGKDVFESAIVDSGVLILRTGGSATPYPSVDMDALPTSEFPPEDEHWGETRPDGDSAWSVLSHGEWRVMEKMQARGTPLSEWDVKINYGIKTGYNAAFIIDTVTRDALVAEDPRSDEIIKPILRGKNIERWRAKWAGHWIIIAKFGSYRTLPNEYPAIFEHLRRHEERLKARGQCRYTRSTTSNDRTDYPGQHHWLELDNNPRDDYLDLMAEEKLLWIELVSRGRFAFDNNSTFAEATTFLMTGGQLKYVCGLLNSRLVYWYLSQVAPTSGMGTLRWKKVYVETIPIPRPDIGSLEAITRLVDSILPEISRDDTTHLGGRETEIDQLVYNLYGLTDEEIAAVEARVSG